MGRHATSSIPLRAPLPARVAAGLAAWSLVALVFTAHGYWFGQAAGRPQPWWPSLGYTLAVFVIWALLTPLIVAVVRRTQASSTVRSIVLAVAGLPAVLGLHAALFVLLFWTVYSDGGRLGPWRVAEGMLLANVHTDVVFYAVVVAGAATWLRRAPSAARAPVAMQGLRVRTRGRVSVLPLAEVAWIEAAGNYAQAHGGGRSVLVDESLAELARRLPPQGFVRIHRRTIVRIDRIAEVQGVGRGDARVRLHDGTELRLSRRFRPALRSWLERGPARPAHGPARGSPADAGRKRP